MKKRRPGISGRRIIQVSSLLLFLVLISLASFPVPPLPPDAFLRMDPLAFLCVILADRSWLPKLWPALAFLFFSFFLGRCFCGYVCPMGTTIDLADTLISPRSVKGRPAFTESSERSWRGVKYLILCFVIGAAVFQISLVFLFSPLSLITRFYATLVFPILNLLGDTGLGFLRPLADRLDLTALAYAQIPLPRYALQGITAAMFVGIFALALAAPRFWCRYLCPAGALFGLCAGRPILHRQVSKDCVQCGQCQDACPMKAIGDDPFKTDHRECIACGGCVRICPVHAVNFSASGAEGPSMPFLPERRRFIGAGISGAGAALISATGLHYRSDAAVPGEVLLPEIIRPPGALPEKQFLNRCIRCGLCLKTCPTNALQPIGFEVGLYGFYSPVIRPRRGPCDAECNACGQVCPTAAIRPLPPEEKRWAKVGTAHILKHKCLAWEFDRKCLVCDEVCPYDAIELRNVDEIRVPVPFVKENRCAGCGFCEYHCPVQARAAIIVAPMEALRLEAGSFQKRGREIGLELNLRKRGGEEDATGSSGLPPGFTE